MMVYKYYTIGAQSNQLNQIRVEEIYYYYFYYNGKYVNGILGILVGEKIGLCFFKGIF